MAVTIACKLPHGLSVKHEGQTLNLNGPAESYDPNNPSPNGVFNDSPLVNGGFGLTELTDDQAALFDSWSDAVTYKPGKDGKATKAAGKLDEPFLPLQNASLIRYDNKDAAISETRGLADMVTSGFEGIDGDKPAAGVEKADGQKGK